MIDLNAVGAHASVDVNNQTAVRFGIYLPQVRDTDGFSVVVRIIHEKDQFDPDIPAQNFTLTCHAPQSASNTSAYELWSTEVGISKQPVTNTNFGAPGRYVYRYQLRKNNKVVCLAFTDPFARATGIGELAAVTVPDPAKPDSPHAWLDAGFEVPDLDDLVVYELQVAEFNDTFVGVADRLDYLKGLGVNALELMPITSTRQEFDWGYGPLHFFSPEEQYGGPKGLQLMVDLCHQAGVAVILDSVYEHVDNSFPYLLVYNDAGLPSPFVGGFEQGGQFGPEVDFRKPFVRDFFRAVNAYWLDEYHIDGFRYDFVPGFYDGPTGQGYAAVAFDTYQHSLPIARFRAQGSYSRLIQVAEHLDAPQQILRDTFTTATWQDRLINKGVEIAEAARQNRPFGGLVENFVHLLDPTFSGYPATKQMNGVQVPVAPFQYIDSHDHSYFLIHFGTVDGIAGKGDTVFGDRSRFFKLQPFAIALYTCQGIPMLWQGQELGANDILPEKGNARISLRREMHWEFFYDDFGQPLVRLYRILAKLRQSCRALRSRHSFYHFQDSRPADGVVAYNRTAPATATQAAEFAVVFLNFSNQEQKLTIPFPASGTYLESIDKAGGVQPSIAISQAGQRIEVRVPSNYGAVYIKQ